MSAPSGVWETIDVAGHPCDVFEPAMPNGHGFVAIYLHGVHLNRLAKIEPFCRALAEHGLPTISPFTGRCWWTDRICPDFDALLTPERHLRENIVTYVAQRWNAKAPRVALFGTSMGGQGALRLAFKYPNEFPIVAAISPAIDYQSRLRQGDEFLQAMYRDDEAARQDTATLHVHPLNWPRNIFFCCDPTDRQWYESSERLQSKLSSLGIPHEADLESSGGGHGVAYYGSMAAKVIGFLMARLDRERQRIL